MEADLPDSHRTLREQGSFCCPMRRLPEAPHPGHIMVTASAASVGSSRAARAATAARTIHIHDPWHKTQSFGRILTQALDRKGTGLSQSQKPEDTLLAQATLRLN